MALRLNRKFLWPNTESESSLFQCLFYVFLRQFRAKCVKNFARSARNIECTKYIDMVFCNIDQSIPTGLFQSSRKDTVFGLESKFLRKNIDFTLFWS